MKKSDDPMDELSDEGNEDLVQMIFSVLSKQDPEEKTELSAVTRVKVIEEFLKDFPITSMIQGGGMLTEEEEDHEK